MTIGLLSVFIGPDRLLLRGPRARWSDRAHGGSSIRRGRGCGSLPAPRGDRDAFPPQEAAGQKRKTLNAAEAVSCRSGRRPGRIGACGRAPTDRLTGSALPLPGRAAYSCGAGRYRVKPGDTLSSIARRFHTSVRRLAAANSLDPAAVLPAGIVLVIPKSDCEAFAGHADGCCRSREHGGRGSRPAVQVPGVSQARTGVVVVDLGSSTVIYALNPDAPLEPASTEKLSCRGNRSSSGSVAASGF